MKDRRKKKLQKFHQKVWPTVVGNVALLLFISIVGIFSVSYSLKELIYQKSEQLNGQVRQVYQNYVRHNSGQSFEEFAEALDISLIGVENICLLDGQKNIAAQYGSKVPDFDEDWIVMINENDISSVHSEDFFQMQVTEQLKKLYEDSREDKFDWYDRVNKKVDILVWYGFPVTLEEQFSDYPKGVLLVFESVLTITWNEVRHIFHLTVLFCSMIFIIVIWNVIMNSKMIRQQKTLIEALYTDTESGGNNMLYFQDRANEILKANKGKKYVFVSLGMDKYSNYCTCYGTGEAELLLESLYEVIKSELKEHEIVAYSHKAIFAVMLEFTGKEELEQRMEQLIDKLNYGRKSQNLVFRVGLYEADSKEDVVLQYNYAGLAREAIPQEKDLRIKWFDQQMLQKHMWEHRVEQDMECALKAHEFQIYLQPKYNPIDRKIVGAEALVRWQHSEVGFVPPNKFIPIFEKNGFILKLDDYMISEISRLQEKWISEGKQVVPISVNVSRAHFTRKDLAEHICSLVDQYHIPHHVIELELTESAFFDDKEILIQTVAKLKEAGFEVSMDDFGAGYSSLNSLKELQLDVLKLDAEFFRGEDSQGRGDIIVSEAIELAKKLDMKIVAEGIETGEQVASLVQKDCDMIQGYYFDKPMPVEEYEKKMYTSE